MVIKVKIKVKVKIKAEAKRMYAGLEFATRTNPFSAEPNGFY